MGETGIRALTEAEIKSKVDSVFQETELIQIPVEVVSMASYYGFSVFELDMEDHISGMIIANDEPIKNFDAKKIIVVNSNHAPTRKRFTVAHELGHYILEEKPEECFAHRDTNVKYNEREKYANSFASALLMPEEDVIRYTASLREDLAGQVNYLRLSALVARRYNVSESAAEVRLKKLALL